MKINMINFCYNEDIPDSFWVIHHAFLVIHDTHCVGYVSRKFQA